MLSSSSNRTDDRVNGALLRLERVDKAFQMGEVAVEALARRLAGRSTEGEMLVMVGPSGSGKTTILNIVGGLDTATAGGSGSATAR